jgi:glycosyltransferase involved in cell wall biosynthesis
VNVLIVQPGADTGGQGIDMQRAFARHAPDWKVRSVTVSRNYLGFDEDLHYPTDKDEIAELGRNADVLHFRSSFKALRLLGLHERRRPRQPVILQHHGTEFREGAEAILSEARFFHAPVYVSTIDLLVGHDQVGWIPAPIEIEDLSAYRGARDPDAPIRIGHCPTVRTAKGTDAFLAAIDELKQRYPIELVLVEGRSWRDCLKIKGTFDLLFDQLTFGFGGNGLEAFAMGIPVVSGAVDPKVLAKMQEIIGPDLPFAAATRETLWNVLERLICDAAERDVQAQRGLEYVKAWHAAPMVVERLKAIYRAAGRRKALIA